jgi:hypothetical protein
MAGTLPPLFRYQFCDSNGDPLSSGTVDFYLAGTSTRENVYSDVSLSTPIANPYTLPPSGKLTFYLSPSKSYKIIAKDSGGNTVDTIDNIPAVPESAQNIDVQGEAGEALTAGQWAYLSDGSGGKTTGKWYKTDADNDYSSILPIVGYVVASLAQAETGSFRLGGLAEGTALSAGSTYYLSATAGAITATAPANARLVGVAQSTTELVMSANPNASLTTTPITTTATGSQNDLALGTTSQRVIVRCNNATALTITGIAGGFAARTVILENVGASTVKVAHQDSGSSAANRAISASTQGQIIGPNGRIELIYDATTERWRIASVEPGAPIDFTPTWTGSGGNPSIGNGTLTGKYQQRGKVVWCEIRLVAGGTTTFGTNTYAWALPLTAAAADRGVGSVHMIDTGTATYLGICFPVSTTTMRVNIMTTSGVVTAAHNQPMTWASTDEMSAELEYEAA